MAEKRYIRMEDWEGNQYYTGASGSSGNGDSGLSVTPDSLITGSATGTITDGTTTTDQNASTGSAIVLTADANADKNLLTTTFTGLTFGNVSGDIRLRSTVASGSTVVIEVKCYYFDFTNTQDGYTGVLLDTFTYTGSDIGIANTYTNLGFLVNYYGVCTQSFGLKVQITLKAGSGATVYLDRLTVAKAYDDFKGLQELSLPVSGWSASAPYTQTVSARNIKNTDRPKIYIYYPDSVNTSNAEDYIEAYSCINRADSENNAIKFTCFTDKPAMDITVTVDNN